MNDLSHRDFLRSEYKILCDSAVFDDEEIKMLRRYGSWLCALAEERIKPETDAQRQFLDVHRAARTPESRYEKLWVKYQAQRIYECALILEGDLERGFSYEKVGSVFQLAASHGHQGAMDWIAREKGKKFPEIQGPGLSIPKEAERPSRIPPAHIMHPGETTWVSRPVIYDDNLNVIP